MKTEETAAKSFADLRVWQKAHHLVLEIYRVSERFPKHELYGLTIQLRRAAVSVPANIVEGFKKRGKPDKVRYFNIAQASLEETRYYLRLARDLGYIEGEVPDVEEVSRLLEGYMKRVAGSAF
jgi:four helix bundle protein